MAAAKLVRPVLKAPNATDEMGSEFLMDKDGTEEALEKLVFGDKAGFLDGLKAHGGSDDVSISTGTVLDVEKPPKDIDEDDLEGVNDSDVGGTAVLTAGWRGLNSAIAVLPGLGTLNNRYT